MPIEYRMQKHNEKLPESKPSQSHYTWVADNGGGHDWITGMIGYSGDKVHVIAISWIPLNGDKVIVGAYSICGSQKWNGGGTRVDLTGAEKTCKKCGAK